MYRSGRNPPGAGPGAALQWAPNSDYPREW